MTEKKTLLEELLDQADRTKVLVQENSKTILGKTAKQVIKESLQEDSDMEDDTIENELPIGGDFTEMDVDADGNDIAADTDETGDMPEFGGESDDEAEGETGEEEEEEIDMTESPYEDVLKAIEALGDGDKVVIVKEPTFDIEVVKDGDDEAETEEIDESVIAEETIAEEEDEESEEMVEESVVTVNESEIVRKKNEKIALYESKILEMKNALSLMLTENKKQKEKEKQYTDAILQTRQLLEDVSLTNVNLLHITRLLTENTVNPEDKDAMLKEFEDKVSTPNESKLIFESWERLLQTKTEKKDNPFKGKTNLNEAVITPKKDKINESKSYEKPKSDFQRFVDHKI
jgi:hypothetical protein